MAEPARPPADHLTAQDVLDLFRGAATGPAGPPERAEIPPARWAYRERTALLGAFEAGTLDTGGRGEPAGDGTPEPGRTITGGTPEPGRMAAGGTPEPGDVPGGRTREPGRTAAGGLREPDGTPPGRDPGPDGAAAGRALREFLTLDCERVSTREGRRWRLAPEVRAQTLERLRTPERMLAALRAAAPGGADSARDWAERFLLGTAPPLREQGFDDLYAALTVVGWFDAAPGAAAALAGQGLAPPSADAVRRRIDLARLLLPLETLVGPAFTGREDELARLAAHVGVPPAEGARAPREGGARTGSRTESGTGSRTGARTGAAPDRPWLMIHGPGGIGKSTLVARFVLDHVARAGAARAGGLPFAYLSFDRADLLPEQPLTLLGEAARQLALLVPELARQARDLEREVRRTLAADRTAETDRGGRGGNPRSGKTSDERGLIHAFARLSARAVAGDDDRPVLLVLDTFEQAQRRDPIAVARLLDFLGSLQSACHGLRIVVAGRAPVDDPRFSGLPLPGFDKVTARAYLRRQLPGEGPEYEAALRSITGAVGPEPLSLKLAAELIRREGPGALLDKRTLRQIQLQLQPEQVQGVLYRRILDHLDDPELRRIASPGLTVRKVSPEIIREVLAGPCGLGTVGEEHARRLFRLLKKEAALVEEVPGKEAVTHRADVRRTMLRLLRRDDASTADRIHEAAVRYYAARPPADPLGAAENRAEELYHRLSLGQEPAVLDERWTDEAGALLEPAVDELPPRGRVYLSERLGITVPRDLRAAADDETWARQALRAGTALLAAEDPGRVLALLGERPRQVDKDIALAVLRIKALAATGRGAEAHALIGPSLDLASVAADPAAFVEVALVGARIDEDRGHFAEARRLLDQAQEAADAPGLEIALLSVFAARLRLHRRGGTADSPAADGLRADLLERLPRDLRERDYARHPTLVRELAAEIGDEVPALVSHTARLLGVPFDSGAGHVLRTSLTEDDVRNFAEVAGLGSPRPPAAAEPTREAGTDDAGENTSAWLAENNSVSRGEAVGDFLDSSPDRVGTWNQALVNTYQHEVDNAAVVIRAAVTIAGSALVAGAAVVVGTGGTARGAAPGRGTTGDAVVIVPGFMGSVLVDTATGDRVWGQRTDQLVPAWARRGPGALLPADHDLDGTGDRIRPVGLLDQAAWAPYFGGFEPYGALRETVLGTVLHRDAVLEFAYDWRLPVARTARLLAAAAAKHLAAWRVRPAARRAHRDGTAREEPRLVFVAHSSGGLVVRAALAQDAPLAERTREVVSLGTPFHGSPKVVTLLGDASPAPGPARLMRDAARRLPGVYDLLPDDRCVEAVGTLRKLTLQDVDRVGGDAALAERALADRDLVRLLPRILTRTRAVVGVGQETVQSLDFSDGGVRAVFSALRVRGDGSPILDGSGNPLRWDRGGDGLVPRDSASPLPSGAVCYVPARHGGLATDRTALAYVRAVLTERAAPLGDFAGLAVHGPAEVGPDRGAGSGTPPPDAGIGLPLARTPGLGLDLPGTVTPGRPWTLTVHGPHTAAEVRCLLTDESTGATVASPRLHATGATLTARITLNAPGLYRVTVKSPTDTTGDLLLSLPASP